MPFMTWSFEKQKCPLNKAMMIRYLLELIQSDLLLLRRVAFVVLLQLGFERLESRSVEFDFAVRFTCLYFC